MDRLRVRRAILANKWKIREEEIKLIRDRSRGFMNRHNSTISSGPSMISEISYAWAAQVTAYWIFNRDLSKWNPISLAKNLNVEVMNSEIRITSAKKGNEVILISEFMNSEMRMTSTFRFFCQDVRISFQKSPICSLSVHFQQKRKIKPKIDVPVWPSCETVIHHSSKLVSWTSFTSGILYLINSGSLVLTSVAILWIKMHFPVELGFLSLNRLWRLVSGGTQGFA